MVLENLVIFADLIVVKRFELFTDLIVNIVVSADESGDSAGFKANNPVSKLFENSAGPSANTGTPTTVRHSAIRTRMKPRIVVLNFILLPKTFCQVIFRCKYYLVYV